MSDPHGGFIQFPLAVLASRSPFMDVIGNAFALGVVHFIQESAEDDECSFTSTSTTTADREKPFARAQRVIGFSGGDIGWTVETFKRADRAVSMWRSAHGVTCSVRIKKEWYFAMRDEDITEVQSRCLMGLLSLLGTKDYVKAGFPMVQGRAAGWLRPLPMDQQVKPNAIIGPIYTRRQIDYALTELCARGFLRTITYNRGERWWTLKLSAEELAAKITEHKTWRHKKTKAQATLEAEISTAVQAARTEAAP